MLKKYIQERLQDVIATKLSESVFNEIVYIKQSQVQAKVEENGNTVNFNTPDGIKLDSYGEPFNLSLIRSNKSSYYLPSESENGLNSIVITVKNNETSYLTFENGFTKQLLKNKSVFIHEFIHMLDDIRSDGDILNISNNRIGGQQEYETFNREVNARFHQIVSKVKENFFDKELGKLKKQWFLKKDKEGSLEEYINSNSEYICNIDYLIKLFKDEIPIFFKYKLSTGLEKKMISRAYTYFKELQKINNINCQKEMNESRINSLMETYRLVSEDDLDEIAYVPSEGIDEKGNQYWLDQAKQGIIRVKNKSSQSTENNIKYELNLEYPNEIITLRDGVHLVALYSNQEISNIEDINIVFMVRYEDYRDGIRIQYTGSTPDARGRGLAIKIYKELKRKFGLPIYSDFAQSSFSRFGIWGKLYNESPNSIKAYNINKSQKFDIVMRPNPKGNSEMYYIDEDVDVKDYKKSAKILGIDWDKNWNKGSQMNWDNVPNDIQEKIKEHSKYKPVYAKKDNEILLVYV